MKCPVMVQLIKKLDTVRAEQSSGRADVDDAGKRKRLRRIEEFLDLHEQTCLTCRQINPHGTKFVEQTRQSRRTWG
jgi:hypothetical protein